MNAIYSGSTQHFVLPIIVIIISLKKIIEIKIEIPGPIGAAPASPRQLTSAQLRQLVCVEGVATHVSTIKPKVMKSCHYNATKNTFTYRQHVDATHPWLGLKAVNALNQEEQQIIKITTGVYPTQDNDGNKLETEFGLSQYKDYQTITLQEMPEKAPMGQLPRSVELILENDLVDRIKPGDRVMVVGIFRALSPAGLGQQTSSGVFRTVLLVNSVQLLGRDANQLNIQVDDVKQIRQLATRDDILSVLGRSFCPSIHGHHIIKKALVLQLLSGVEKNLENGTHLRGDINILMVGDPSTAKSQLLRAAMTVAQLAVSTTGKGSSGVGLTAAVTTDPETNERRLEAGAMVLADRGLVCVDEFDKMGESDRVAIHEAMEQQTVTIAKAGIHASLNARCSVLAAANPVYGQYDRRRRIQENIGLPDSLLSRFDLLFVVLDQMDPESDRRIASHVVRGHRYRNDQGLPGYNSDDDDDDELYNDRRARSIWQRNRSYVADEDAEENRDVLTHEFLRKYLFFAKTRFQPVLTVESREYIATRYAEMRARQDERTLPITARSLETIIRLATAHAKCRLSNEVEADPDCAVAMEILSFALYHEHMTPIKNVAPSPRTVLPIPDDHGGGPDDNGDGGEQSTKRRRLSEASNEMNNGSVSDDETAERSKRLVWETLQNHGDCMEINELLGCGNPDDVQRGLRLLTHEGRIQVSDGQAYIV